MTTSARPPVPSAMGGPVRASSRHLLITLAFAAFMIALGIWYRWPEVTYSGLPSAQLFAAYEFEHKTHSDIAYLYFRDNLSRHPIPFLHYQLEYPVGIGAFIYLLNFFRTLAGYMLASSVVLGICGLVAVALLTRFPGAKAYAFALSPTLILYSNLNWDLLGIVMMVVALLLFARHSDELGAVALTAAVWTKFFPIVLLPLIVADRLRGGRYERAGMVLVVFGFLSLAMNAPILLTKPESVLYFFTFNQERPREYNLWFFISDPRLTTSAINLFIGGLLAAGIGAMALAIWKRGASLLPMCCAALAWFLFINKVYSPQYSIWIAVALALAGARAWLVIAFALADVMFFAAVSLWVGLPPWLPGQGDPLLVLRLTTAARELTIAVFIVWCVQKALSDGTNRTGIVVSGPGQPEPAETHLSKASP